jgi:DNA-binding transcriptional LysR family regulator
MQRNPITIEALETLDAIDRRGSFAKASEEMNKATSAVSYSVQRLEEQLGITLFQRQGRRSVLTPAGQLVLTEGREILQTTARLVNQAKEIATGWEPRISIALESLQPYSVFFGVLRRFLEEYPTMEIDVIESVLNGGWEALDQGRVDLLVGSPGAVPQQKGYRAIPVSSTALVPVIAASHEMAAIASNTELLATKLVTLRRVITHDTSLTEVSRSAGLSSEGRKFYVQNIDQKVEAILAGIGIGHLPRQRVQKHLDTGELIELSLGESPSSENFIAWKVSNKGRGLQALTRLLLAEMT